MTREAIHCCNSAARPLFFGTWLRTPSPLSNSDFVKEMLELAGRGTPRTVAYGTDGAMFTEMKKLVVFGPGDIAQAHTHDEWIELEQLDLGTEAYAKLIRRWCC